MILRRVDAAWSDPLELRGDSQLGVAGLVEAVRRGRVRVVNGLGAGVLENPGLLPFLPAACEALLGEPLRLPSVPTWWCGDPDGLDHVLDRLDELVGPRRSTAAPDAPRRPRADELRARVLADAAPLRRPGAAAALAGADLVARRHAAPVPVTLRTFTLRYGSAYRPLVGGLASGWLRPPTDADQQGRLGAQGQRPATPTRACPTCCR